MMQPTGAPREHALVTALFFGAFFILGTAAVFAHAVVSPAATITSKYETFSLSVPTEKDIPTVGVRLLIPDALDRVTPFVKSGWTITVKKDPANPEKITEINWTGGMIPAGQKDAFSFT